MHSKIINAKLSIVTEMKHVGERSLPESTERLWPCNSHQHRISRESHDGLTKKEKRSYKRNGRNLIKTYLETSFSTETIDSVL